MVLKKMSYKRINKDYKEIILSLGRAEKYKNLEGTMLLGDCMKLKPVVVAQSYCKGQPIIKVEKKYE